MRNKHISKYYTIIAQISSVISWIGAREASWLSGRPSRWHPQHMWHDLPQRGYRGEAPSHRANSRRRAQMWVTPWGKGGGMRCPSLCGSADAPHNCQAFSFIRPRSDTYRGVQPEAIAAAPPPCRHTGRQASRHTHTHTHTHTQHTQSQIHIWNDFDFHQRKYVMTKVHFFSRFGFWTCPGSTQLSQSRRMCVNLRVFE